ncbi:MAG: HAMP domain-containing histidine kinase [Actinomycetota bacterium]|nr:HAMP domain-containing histidine kinase [Actinomycetota bacterium]MDQ6948394.1 HAMP domain-containing histidine kinase [Actinomycetota bacterium]
MQRRLRATIIGVVVGAIFLTGVVTFVLVAHAARVRTRDQLAQQAQDVAGAIKGEILAGRDAANLLRILRAPFNHENDVVLIVSPAGRLIDISQPRRPATLPPGLTAAMLHSDRLLAGQVVSGNSGAIVYAAAPYQSKITMAKGVTPTLTQVVVLTRSADSGLRHAWPWFVLSAVIVLLIATWVGDRLGRRISRPLRDAETVTRQIAAGDLSAQVPLPDRAYPELASLAHSINTMAGTLARAKGLERQFLLSVSHDLRTPLTSIRGFAEAIAEGAAPDNARAAEVIAAESRRLERLVKDLLDLATFDARRFGLDLRPIDLAELITDTGDGFRPAAEELGLRLDLAPEPVGAIMATADPDRLAQVVANLVENALKYARTRVAVGVASSGEGPVIWVDDDGPGITAEDLPRVFDRLFMSSRYPARQVGTGLGLAIVSELVTAMGGSVRAESPTSRTGGTRMVVTLPSSSRVTAPTMSAV